MKNWRKSEGDNELEKISNSSILLDANFWLNAFIGVIAFIAVFVLSWIKSDIGKVRDNIDKLFDRTEQAMKDIAVCQKDVENMRAECERRHGK